jgi:diguanylate cyclase (GGDEF)-like protein
MDGGHLGLSSADDLERDPGGLGGPVVLVAEDSAEVRLLLRFELEASGYQVIEAADGLEAIKQCTATRPDAVLLDVNLPGADGYTVLRHLKLDPDLCEIPVLVVTANDGSDGVVEALRLGAHDHVLKPFRPVEVIARVEAAMRMRSVHDGLRHASRTDVLTGLPNRRALEEQLDQQAALAARHEREMSVLVVDVDHFKNVNDRVGHAGGDVVLRTVADRLCSVVRSGDVVGRWGGEEFLVLLPLTGTAGAAALAERVRGAMAADVVEAAGRRMFVTVSIGCSTGLGSPELLVARADAALYEAKAAGRNAVRPALTA